MDNKEIKNKDLEKVQGGAKVNLKSSKEYSAQVIIAESKTHPGTGTVLGK